MVTIAELNPSVDDAAKGFEVRVEGLSPQLQEVLRSNGWLGIRHWMKIGMLEAMGCMDTSVKVLFVCWCVDGSMKCGSRIRRNGFSRKSHVMSYLIIQPIVLVHSGKVLSNHHPRSGSLGHHFFAKHPER